MNLVVILLFVILTVVSSKASVVFLSAFGNDNNDGSQASPVKTVNRAYTLAGAGGRVIMKPGVYTNNGNEGIDIRYNITFEGENFENSSPYLTRISCSMGGAEYLFGVNIQTAVLTLKGIAVTGCKQTIHVNEGSFSAYKSVIRGNPTAIYWRYGGSIESVTLEQSVLEGEQATSVAVGVLHECRNGRAHTLTMDKITMKNLQYGVSLLSCKDFAVELAITVRDSTLEASESVLALSAKNEVTLTVQNTSFVTTGTNAISLEGGVQADIRGAHFAGTNLKSTYQAFNPQRLNITDSVFSDIRNAAVDLLYPVNTVGIRNTVFVAPNPPVDDNALRIGINADLYTLSVQNRIDMQNLTFSGVDLGVFLHSKYSSGKPMLTGRSLKFTDVGNALRTDFGVTGADVNVDLTNVQVTRARNTSLHFIGNPTVTLKYVEVSDGASSGIFYDGTQKPAGRIVMNQVLLNNNWQGMLIDGPHLVEAAHGTFKDNGDMYDYNGGAIDFTGRGQLNLQECTFSHNRGRNGGAVYLSGPHGLFVGCKFLNNEAVESGGAVTCVGDGTLTVGNSVFFDNHAPDGASGSCKDGSCAAEGYDNQVANNGPGASTCSGF